MSEQRFPREARLLSGAEFKRVFSARRVESNRHFRIHRAAAPHPERGSARLGLAISRRVARRAVDRNRIKRLVRESFRVHRSSLPAEDYVVLAKPAAVGAESRALHASLDQLWLRFESQ